MIEYKNIYDVSDLNYDWKKYIFFLSKSNNKYKIKINTNCFELYLIGDDLELEKLLNPEFMAIGFNKDIVKEIISRNDGYYIKITCDVPQNYKRFYISGKLIETPEPLKIIKEERL